MRKLLLFFNLLFISSILGAQLKWQNVDPLFQPLPSSVHAYFTEEKIDTGSFKAYYLIADLKDKKIEFTVDTTLNRRLTPSKFYERNDKALVVVNCTFFSFETNSSLNAVIRDRKLVAFNDHVIAGRGKDTMLFLHPLSSAIGISKKRKPDVTWLFTDSVRRYPIAFEKEPQIVKSNYRKVSEYEFAPEFHHLPKTEQRRGINDQWKMRTAVGGGPVLLQNGNIMITNNEELRFAGKAINDKHPRTAMGYTKDGTLIILVIQGRSESSGGASLTQEAQILKDIGCWEALNLDGGGSSCMLINGKETIKPSDKEGQRPVPVVFLIKTKD